MALDSFHARLARVKSVASLAEEIGLADARQRFRCPAPDHDDKTPAASIQPRNPEFWKCWACGAQGDVVNYIAKRDGLRNVEALRILEAKHGLGDLSDADRQRAAKAKAIRDAEQEKRAELLDRLAILDKRLLGSRRRVSILMPRYGKRLSKGQAEAYGREVSTLHILEQKVAELEEEVHGNTNGNPGE